MQYPSADTPGVVNPGRRTAALRRSIRRPDAATTSDREAQPLRDVVPRLAATTPTGTPSTARTTPVAVQKTPECTDNPNGPPGSAGSRTAANGASPDSRSA